MGFGSPTPSCTIPYSVSIPQTFCMATTASYRPHGPCTAHRCVRRLGARGHRSDKTVWLEVLTGRDPFDGPTAGGLLVLALREQDPQEDDALALLAGDLGPVVGVGGVGEVLVLLVLLADRGEQVLGADAFALACDLALDGQLLGPPHDVLDHGARREVLEVHDFFVTVLVGDLDEPVLVVGRVHL